uniref:INO80 complex subunit E N-terminal domain-containing protein n=1 Tax=Otus sunia TaxID=257818 RepID=A0A8C8AUA6_9STRI
SSSCPDAWVSPRTAPLKSMPKGPRQRPAERYRLKYSRLRRAARALVFENGALCDEVARLEAKCLQARDERRFLLTRLLQLRAMAGPEEVPGEVAGRRPRRGGSRADGGWGQRRGGQGHANEARGGGGHLWRWGGPWSTHGQNTFYCHHRDGDKIRGGGRDPQLLGSRSPPLISYWMLW